jgi:hypothetical protein
MGEASLRRWSARWVLKGRVSVCLMGLGGQSAVIGQEWEQWQAYGGLANGSKEWVGTYFFSVFRPSSATRAWNVK